jgi:hypothetical protein
MPRTLENLILSFAAPVLQFYQNVAGKTIGKRERDYGGQGCDLWKGRLTVHG